MENPFPSDYIYNLSGIQRKKLNDFSNMTKKELINYSNSNNLGLTGLFQLTKLRVMRKICDVEFKTQSNKSDEINNKIDELLLNIFQVKDKLEDVEVDMLTMLAINGIIEDMIKKLRDIKGERNKLKGVKL